jgi:hypothetical protein
MTASESAGKPTMDEAVANAMQVYVEAMLDLAEERAL